MKVLIAAAGTGGHINPGIAIANKIKKEHKDAKIIFIGTTRGLENDLVPKAGYELQTIQAYGFTRRINIENLKNVIKTLKGFKQAKKIIKKEKPDIVIGTGGYICLPVFNAAYKAKIPTILHESNAFPGMSVKILSKKVNTILVGFDDTKNRLSKAKNVVVTGTPTKMENINLTQLQKDNIKQQLGFNINNPLVLIFGGSQGAKTINETLINIIKNKRVSDYQIIWAAGTKQYDIIKEFLENENININNIKNIKIVPYIYNMQEVMSVADIVIARSGAMTVTELSVMGKPSICIPFPFATENHQEYNARVLEKAGAAKIILDKELNEEKLLCEISEMLKDKEKLKEMGENAKKVSIKNVEDKIYNEIKSIVL